MDPKEKDSSEVLQDDIEDLYSLDDEEAEEDEDEPEPENK